MFTKTRLGIPAFWQIAAGLIVLIAAVLGAVWAASNNANVALFITMLVAVFCGYLIASGVTTSNRAEHDAEMKRQAEFNAQAAARSPRPGTQDH